MTKFRLTLTLQILKQKPHLIRGCISLNTGVRLPRTLGSRGMGGRCSVLRMPATRERSTMLVSPAVGSVEAEEAWRIPFVVVFFGVHAVQAAGTVGFDWNENCRFASHIICS